MGLIYMRISPSGGKYIGQTRYSENKRWKSHILEAFNKNNNNYNSLLNLAIRKYGPENFSVTILENNIDEKLLDNREIYWIEFYHTYYLDNQHGYNMTRGGSGHSRHQNNDILNLWLAKHNVSEISNILNATISTISQRLIEIGINQKEISFRGIQKRIFKIFEQNQNKEQIKMLWDSGKNITEISIQTGTEIHAISRILKQFYNISDNDIRLRKNQTISNKNSKPILQYDINNNFIREWPSATVAANELSLDISTIRKCIKGQRKTTGGFIWKQK